MPSREAPRQRLRKLLAVDGSDGAGVYPLPASDLAVFG